MKLNREPTTQPTGGSLESGFVLNRTRVIAMLTSMGLLVVQCNLLLNLQQEKNGTIYQRTWG